MTSSKHRAKPLVENQLVVFCGTDALIRKLIAMETLTEDLHAANEIKEVIVELALLNLSLRRLRYERSWVDEQDIDLAIDRLMGIHQGDVK